MCFRLEIDDTCYKVKHYALGDLDEPAKQTRSAKR